MQFLRTLEGRLIPETHVVQISERIAPDKKQWNDGGGITVPFHRVLTTSSLQAEMREPGSTYFQIATAREVARFIKACEAPEAPARRPEGGAE